MINGFRKTSALSGSYSRFVVRVSLLNSDWSRKNLRWDTRTAVVPSYMILSSGFETVRWILKTYIGQVHTCDASATAKDVQTFMQFLNCACICICPVSISCVGAWPSVSFCIKEATSLRPSSFVACVRQEPITGIILLLIYMHLPLKRKRRGRIFLI